MDNPLLSYIDVRHPNLLPSNLIVGEAQDLSPWLVRANSLVPMRDASVDSVFQGRVVHLLVEEPRVEVWPTDQAEVESINSPEVEAEQGEGDMIIRRTMTVDWFLLGARLTTQQQLT